MQVTKRDGRIVEFDGSKIVRAIEAAMSRTSIGIDHALSSFIAQKIEGTKNNYSVEEIQDLVENYLMSSDRKDVAKEYILFRAERTKQRELKGNIVQKAAQKISGKNIENSNANVDEATFGGRKNEASAIVQKEIALNMNMSPEVAQAHKSGLIYEHDLDAYNVGMHNCLFEDIEQLFKNGFKTRNGDVRRPSNFATACQLVAVAFQLQSQCQFGGVASAHLDIDLAPFVAKSFTKHLVDGLKYVSRLSEEEIDSCKTKFDFNLDDKTMQTAYPDAWNYAIDMLEREGQQASEALYHNLNTLESRAGSQVPFTSINYGRDTSTEGRLVSKWLLNASINGIGEHYVTPIFPIGIFSYKKGVNAYPGDKNYDLKRLALESMAKRIYPNWCNGDFSEAHENPNDPDTIYATMGCRTAIGYDRNGLGYKRVGRGNNIPITIILPKLAIEYGICLNKREYADIEGFWNAFEDTLKLVEKALLERFEILKSQSPKAAPFMYENGTIADADKCKDNVFESIKHNTLAIGYIGIAEMCQALFGKDHSDDAQVHAFALKVVSRINKFAKEASERNGLNFGCYATPAESLCMTAMSNLKKQYGVIQNVTDREYLTNSHHVPVWKKVSIYDKLRIEAPFCRFPTAGCITYIECESSFMKNLDAVEDIIDYAFNLDIPYLAFNFPIDTCMDCGYSDEFDAECPKCGSKNILQLRRVTGYLSVDYRRFNDGKQHEVLDRVKHDAFTRYDPNER